MASKKSAEARRQEIADAALRVIAEQGLGRFTALAIAREVGLTDGALFRHFATKEAIVLAAIDRVGEILFDGFPPQGEDPIERLGAFFRRRVEMIGGHPGVARLVNSEDLARAAPPEGVARVAEFRRRSQAFVRSCLAEAGRRGLLAPGLTPAEAAVIVLGSLMALAHFPAVATAGEPVGPLSRRVWRALEGLLRGSRAGRAAVSGRERLRTATESGAR
jgi:AcrR family transcriptional regulator